MKATLGRLPIYLQYLKSLDTNQYANISATIIAKSLGLGEVQVRKDLSAVSGAGRPKLGLSLTILGGVANMVLDYVFIAVLGFGIRGAALATAMSYCIPAVGGLIFFSVLNRKGLHFTIPSRQLKLVTESCINGSSEMVSNLSGSVTTLLFNLVMLDLAGSDGVAAITAICYLIGMIASALPVTQFIKGEDQYGNEKNRWKTFAEAAPYWVLPGGYGQCVLFSGGGHPADRHYPPG